MTDCTAAKYPAGDPVRGYSPGCAGFRQYGRRRQMSAAVHCPTRRCSAPDVQVSQPCCRHCVTVLQPYIIYNINGIVRGLISRFNQTGRCRFLRIHLAQQLTFSMYSLQPAPYTSAPGILRQRLTHMMYSLYFLAIYISCISPFTSISSPVKHAMWALMKSYPAMQLKATPPLRRGLHSRM